MATCSTERGEFTKAAKDAQEAREKKMAALDSAIKRDRIAAKVASDGGIKTASETLHGLLRGTYKSIKDGALSVQSLWHARETEYASLFGHELEKNGLTKAFNSGLMDKEIYSAMYKLQNGEKIGNSPMSKLAQIIIHFTDKARDNVNAAGGKIRDARDYAIATSHDSEKLRGAAGKAKTLDEAFKAWYGDIKQWMSPKTFRGDVPLSGETVEQMQERIMRDHFDSLYTGVHEKIGSTESGFVNPDIQNTVNISNKVSAHRMIVWKDGESAYSYSKKYGKNPNLASTVSSILDRMAKAEALMSKFGNNPMSNLNMVMRRLEETYKTDGDGLREFQGKIENIRNEMAVLDGTANIPANMGFAKGASVVRELEDMMHLGGVTWTHFFSGAYSIPNMAAHSGINRLSTVGMMAKSIFKGKSDGEMGKIAAEYGAFGDGLYRHQQSIFGQDNVPGKVSTVASKFMESTGIHFLFDRWKTGIKDMLSHNLATQISSKFEKLEPHVKNELSRYGIGDKEWSLIQKANLRDFNGRKYLTPASIEEGLREIDNVSGRDLSDKIMSYLSDNARAGVVTAGVKEQAMMYGGLKRGTFWGETARFLGQFKAWPLAAWNQIIERDIYQSLSKKEAAYNLGMLVAIGVPAGYAREYMNAKLAGREPPNPASIKTLLSSAGASGALGIMGDSLFGQIDRMSKEGIYTLAGPVASDISDVAKLYAKAMTKLEGEKSNLWPDLAHMAVNHVPFANLFYVKGAFDYLIAYHLIEAANPGWWERANQRMEKENGGHMVGYSPGAGVPYGVPGVYLQKNGASSGVLGNGKLGNKVY